MDNKGLIFYRKMSPYPGDYTKNSALSGDDVDNNFFNLKSADIDTMTWDDETKSLTLTRMDGGVLSVNDIVKESVYSFVYDNTQGELTITIDGREYVIGGFVTADDMVELAVDYTMTGDGTMDKPLGLSGIVQTGFYKPAKKIIDTIGGESLPFDGNLKPGDRYVTYEAVSDYGMLYNYNGVIAIKNDLACQGSEWRIPSKEDWDDMLNAIETNPEYKNHNNSSSNRALGQFAGKFLKSVDQWLLEGETPSPTPCPPCTCGADGCVNGFICTCANEPYNTTPNRGVDKYGFTVLPAGYGDGGLAMDYFKMRTAFWTSTQVNSSDIYSKRFDYNKSTVYQELVGPYSQYSIRLVKDYNGQNYFERESINGQNYNTIIMPDINGNLKVWTQTNINFIDSKYCGVKPNGGVGILTVQKYFLNEWDGQKWLRLEMLEGDTVVLNNGADGSINEAWRVIKEDTGNFLMINEVKDILSQVGDKYDSRIDRLENGITTEINRAMAAEARIDSRVDSVINSYVSMVDLERMLLAYVTIGKLTDEYYDKPTIDQKLSEVGTGVVKTVSSSTPAITIGGTDTDVMVGLVIDGTTETNIKLVQNPNGLSATANIDLSDYVTEVELVAELGNYYTKAETDRITNTKISDVISDSDIVNIKRSVDNVVTIDVALDQSGNVVLSEGVDGLKGDFDDSHLITTTVFDAKIIEINTRTTELDSNIKTETVRATDAEEMLRVAIETEVARALNAEQDINNALENISNYGEY